jgi:RNA polymerase sigma factor (sigma-70 family)
MQDDQLLTQYALTGSNAAFSQLVARHLPLVYRTCRRELGSETLAEDAAQVVFLLLAGKAKTLRAGPSLAGWLFQTARFVAKDVRKQELRRQRREEAVMQKAIHQQATATSEWNTVEPLLNPALAALKPAEREAVLLRFFEGLTLAETGTSLGVSEDAARMRCARALEKLRHYLTSHGAAVTGAVLTGLLTTEAAHPVPAHAAAMITQGTLQAISTGPTANVLLLSKGVSQTMKITKLKIAALAATILVAGIVIMPVAHSVSTNKSFPVALPVNQAQQDAFLLGLTQYDCNQRAEKLREDNEALSSDLHDPQIVAATFSLMNLKTKKAHERQGQASLQTARILTHLNAPPSLQSWATQVATKLNSPPNIPDGDKARADADLATPEFSLVQDAQEPVLVYSVEDEIGDIQNESNAHQDALTSWLARRGDNAEWTRQLGALAAALNFREVKVERQQPTIWPQTIAGSLAETAPADTPANVRQDLERLSALSIGSNPTGTDLVQAFDTVRADLLKTYSVKPTQIWPI